MSLVARFRWFLVPSVLQGAVSFATLPLATLLLGPADYGAFAVVSAITALGGAISSLGSTYLFSKAFSKESPEQVRQAVSQQVVFSMSIAVVFAITLILAWRQLAKLSSSLMDVPTSGLVLSALAMVPATLWALALDVLTLDGRAKTFALVGTAQSLVSAATLLCGLFLLGLEGVALFLSGAIGSIVAGAGGYIVLRRYLEWPRFSKNEFGALRGAVSLTVANVIEVIYLSVERNLLAVLDGLASLGLYSHSQQYRLMVGVATKALARSVWPVTLNEAKICPTQFRNTGHYWGLAHLVLSFVGLVFAALGVELIGLLTHGKFSDAGPYAAMGIAYLLIQNCGKPQTGVLYADGESKLFARISIVATLCALATALYVIPLFGIWGALLALFIQQVVLRLAIQFYVARMITTPFQDGWALAGFGVIIFLVVINEEFQLSLLHRSVWLVMACIVLAGSYLLVSRMNGKSVQGKVE